MCPVRRYTIVVDCLELHVVFPLTVWCRCAGQQIKAFNCLCKIYNCLTLLRLITLHIRALIYKAAGKLYFVKVLFVGSERFCIGYINLRITLNSLQSLCFSGAVAINYFNTRHKLSGILHPSVLYKNKWAYNKPLMFGVQRQIIVYNR